MRIEKGRFLVITINSAWQGKIAFIEIVILGCGLQKIRC